MITAYGYEAFLINNSSPPIQISQLDFDSRLRLSTSIFNYRFRPSTLDSRRQVQLSPYQMFIILIIKIKY